MTVGKIRFRNILALFFAAALIAALVYYPDLDGTVKGAFIAVITLVAQFYFRKAPKNESSGGDDNPVGASTNRPDNVVV